MDASYSDLSRHIIETATKQFVYYQHLAEQTIDQLTPEQWYLRGYEHQTSIALVMQHVAGNMLSRWTNIYTEDGEKPWRNRDGEFVLRDEHQESDTLHAYWTQAWMQLYTTLASITPDDYKRILYIRNEGHTLTEALLRQQCHYAYHVGQIVWMGKELRGSDWEYLSIPPAESEKYNASKFGKIKSDGHFTDLI